MSSQNDQNVEGSSESLPQDVAAGIFHTNTVIIAFHNLINAIGTSKDTPDLRQKLHGTRKHVMTLVKDVSAKLKTLNDSDLAANVHRDQKIEDAKFARDFQATLKEFQKVQKRSLERESSFISSEAPTSSVVLDLTSEEATQDIESQPLLLEKKRSIWLDGKLGFDEGILEEREQDEKIKEMQRQLDEIRDFNKELAALLHEHDAIVTDVSTAGSNESKPPHLRKAPKSGRSCSPLYWWLLAFVVVAAIIVLLILVL